jgi:hypothetical protein
VRLPSRPIVFCRCIFFASLTRVLVISRLPPQAITIQLATRFFSPSDCFNACNEIGLNRSSATQFACLSSVCLQPTIESISSLIFCCCQFSRNKLNSDYIYCFFVANLKSRDTVVVNSSLSSNQVQLLIFYLADCRTHHCAFNRLSNRSVI